MSPHPIQRLKNPPWFLVRIPEVRPDSLVRPDLYREIDDIVDQYPLTLVKAPSGFGKTTALSLWARHRSKPTGWYTLMTDHGTVEDLLAGVLAALIHVLPRNTRLVGVQTKLFKGDLTVQEANEGIIDALRNEEQITIVIDDAQLSTRDAIQQVVSPLGAYSAGHLRFVLAGTHSIHSWLTKELASRQAKPLDSTHLTFTQVDIETILEETHAPVDADFGREVWERTNGWPLAVQLLLLACQSADGGGDISTKTAQITIATYIRDNVLVTLSPELRQFVLLATTVNRFDTDLARTITGFKNSEELIDECRRKGLFLDAFPEKGMISYKWHSYFAEVCQTILKLQDPEGYHEAHRRASDWMEHGYPVSSLRHALLTDDDDFILATIETLWLPLITSGQSASLEKYLHRLPDSIKTHPAVFYILSCCRNLAGDYVASKGIRGRADLAMSSLSREAREHTRQISLYTTLITSNDYQELVESVTEVERALRASPLSADQLLHQAFVAGWTMMRLRYNPRSAVKLLSAALHGAQATHNSVIAARASANLAFALSFAGEFTKSKALLSQITHDEAEAGRTFDHFEGGADSMAAQLAAYWQGDMEKSVAYGKELIAFGGPASSNATLGRVFLGMAAAYVQDSALWDESLELTKAIPDTNAHGVPWPAYKAIAGAYVHWARGEKSAAINTLGSIRRGESMTTTWVLTADLWRRLDFPDQALASLALIDPETHVNYTGASHYFTLAAITFARGDKEAAHNMLEKSLDYAEPEGVGAPYVALDKVGKDMLIAHVGRRTQHRDFVLELLAKDDARDQMPVKEVPPLSTREQEILGYLDSPLSAQEIAKALFISPATVRTHQQSIYRKLDVKCRKDAVRLALHLGLLRGN